MSKQQMRNNKSDENLKKRIVEEGYKDAEGNSIALEKLVKQDPDWAANLIRFLKKKLQKYEEKTQEEYEFDPKKNIYTINQAGFYLVNGERHLFKAGDKVHFEGGCLSFTKIK